MRITIANLRFWIAGLAVLLVAVLAGFFVYERHKASHILSDLPDKLGVQIAQSSDAYTLSRTGKNGKPAFSLHASKAVQFTGGNGAVLHDVVITLYGVQGDRADRIAGSEFDYNQKSGTVTAKGEVQIDLQGAGEAAGGRAPQASGAGGVGVFSPAAAVHIKTSGLVFNQNTQIATTSAYVEFHTPKADGHSTGATYDVQQGLLILNSAVELHSDHDGAPIVVHASHAEFLRGNMQASLLNPVTEYKADHTASDQAIVFFRKDGSAEHIETKGHVHFKTDGGQQLTAGAAKILLDLRSQPTRADASGGLNFVSNPVKPAALQHQMHGNAVEGTVLFGPGGALTHAQARDAVSFVDAQNGLAGDPGGSATRELRASKVDVDFVEDGNGHSVASKVLAAGGASAVLHTIRTKSTSPKTSPAGSQQGDKGGSQNTTIKGDELLADLQDGRAITSLHGAGHTSVLDVTPTGATNLSTGDVLQVNFSPNAKGSKQGAPTPGRADAGGSMDSTQIESVMQEGNVVMVQTPAAASEGHAAGAPARATAQRANYDAATEVLRLEGSPHIKIGGEPGSPSGNPVAGGSGTENGTTDVAADTIDYHRDTSIANAVGNVKATYFQLKSGQGKSGQAKAGPAKSAPAAGGFGGDGPTHVISATAVLDQTHGFAVFKGQARLWQGSNSVNAPVIELMRNPETLKAYADPAAVNAVYTVMATAGSAQHASTVMRVHSRQLLYVDADRKATFTGAVTAEDPSGTVHADETEVFLMAEGNPSVASPRSADGSGGIERVIASGHVVLQQPGRRGTGEKLLYTANDGKFILTGTSATPPHLYDQTHGTVSGEALIFNRQDDSVVVSGGQSKAVTDTRTAK
jgi:lipopolysaccharide export system protein LptA